MLESADADLLADWLERQRESAFHALVARYAGLVHRAAMRTCGDEALAAEAAQLTFITLARRAKSLASRSSIGGWLHFTAVMQSRNLLRHHRRESRKRQLLSTHMDKSPADPAATAWWQTMQPVLDEALASLSAGDRETLLLRFYRSFSVKEIAAALGIATDAAQKRLDRATERLRRQLARRGCQAGGSLSAAMLAGFGADAQALVPGVSLLASNALAAGSTGAAGGTFLTTTIALMTMTKKTAIIAGVALLLAGTGTVAYINRDPGTPEATVERAAGRSGTRNSVGLSPVDDSTRVTKVPRRNLTKNPEFVEKYGEARTNLSKHVADNIISLLEEASELDALFKSSGLDKRSEDETYGTVDRVLPDGLNLTDEQHEKATAAHENHKKRNLARSKDRIERMKKDPTELMNLLLVSDSFARGEITEDQYREATKATANLLDEVVNPLGSGPKFGDEPIEDEAFLRELEAILDPAQNKIFERSVTERDSSEGIEDDSGSIAGLESMSLEGLEKKVVAGRTALTAMKTVIENTAELKGLVPPTGK